MLLRRSATAVAAVLGLLAGGALLATPAHAAFLTERFLGDTTFTERCNGTACEQAVAEARYGNGALNGDWEQGVGFPTTQPPDQEINRIWTGDPQDFTLSYDGSELSFFVEGGQSNGGIETVMALGSLDDSTSIFIRTDSRNGNGANITGLTFNDMMVGDGQVGTAGDVAYLAFVADGLSSSWTLKGQLELIAGTIPKGSQPSLQFKLTDATVVPVPAALPLLATGLAALGYVRHRRKRQETAAA